jgi:hypothetical protein
MADNVGTAGGVMKNMNISFSYCKIVLNGNVNSLHHFSPPLTPGTIFTP